MPQGTTPAIPSPSARGLIADATREGLAVEQKVEAFVARVRAARTAFADEVGPLHLPDERYMAVADAIGLTGLLDLASRMEGALVEAVAAR